MVDMVAAEGVATSAMRAVRCVQKQTPENKTIAWKCRRYDRTNVMKQRYCRVLDWASWVELSQL